jgi:hypothetical protein
LRASQEPQNAPPDFFADPDQAVDRRIAAALQRTIRGASWSTGTARTA